MPSYANLENPTFSYQNEASNLVSPMRRLEGMDWGAIGDPDFDLIVMPPHMQDAEYGLDGRVSSNAFRQSLIFEIWFVKWIGCPERGGM